MIAEEVALRYSQAIFDLGGSPEQLTARLAALETVVNTLEAHRPLRKLLLAPHLTYDEQLTVLQKMAEHVHGDAQVVHFLNLLLRKRRLQYLGEIVEAFKKRVKQALGVVDAHVVTAVPLNNTTRTQLRSRLEAIYAKKLTFVEAVDPKIIGGAILVVDRRMIDFSVITRLAKFRDQLLAISLS